MRIGVPKYRVGLVPATVAELTRRSHQVTIERNAGAGSGIPDADYVAAGATVAPTAADIWANAEMVVKVKEPLADERRQLRRGQILFTYLHLAPDLPQTKDLIASGAICIAYETVTAPNGSLPLLTPMSEVAGRLAPQVGARALEKASGGEGVLLGGVPGVPPAEVVILGGGVSGSHAAAMSLGVGANVAVLDRSVDVLRRLSAQFGTSLRTAVATQSAIAEAVRRCDLLIGCVLVPGSAAPKLVTRDMLRTMKPGAAIVDVAIDQGGCCETSRPTTHADPIYIVDGIVHYCVANMPGAVARTSTFALNNATLPFVLALADKGWKVALAEDRHLLAGLNVHDGKITYAPVAVAHKLPYVDPTPLLH